MCISGGSESQLHSACICRVNFFQSSHRPLLFDSSIQVDGPIKPHGFKWAAVEVAGNVGRAAERYATLGHSIKVLERFVNAQKILTYELIISVNKGKTIIVMSEASDDQKSQGSKDAQGSQETQAATKPKSTPRTRVAFLETYANDGSKWTEHELTERFCHRHKKGLDRAKLYLDLSDIDGTLIVNTARINKPSIAHRAKDKVEIAIKYYWDTKGEGTSEHTHKLILHNGINLSAAGKQEVQVSVTEYLRGHDGSFVRVSCKFWLH